MQQSLAKMKFLVLVLLSVTFSLFLFNAVWADATDTAAGDGINAPATVPTLPPLYTYLSSSSNTKVGGVSVSDEDIVRYNSGTDEWKLFFDGSDVGLAKNDVDAFDLLADDPNEDPSPLGYSILLSFEKKFSNFPGIGTVQDSDILKFTPTIVGSSTAGSFAMYLDGSTVGLSGSSEDIDAIAFDPAGRLVISTVGTAKVPGLTAKDEDLMVWNGSAWELYLDGSAIQLTKGDEDVSGAWIDPTGDKNIYLSTKGKFNAASGGYVAAGDRDDIFGVSPGAATPPITAGALFAHFDGDEVGFTKKIDDFFISFTGVPETTTTAVTSAAVDEATIVQYDVAEDEASVEADEELTAEDAAEEDAVEEDAAEEDVAEESTATRLFLPTVFK